MLKLSVAPRSNIIRYAISASLLIEIIYAFCNRNVWIEGHFDNPAGFAMFVVACFPFVYCIDYVQRNSYLKHSVEIIIMAIIAAAGSRAGIIALNFIIGSAYYKNRKRDYNLWVKAAAAIFLSVLFIGLYLLKKDSADGRILIWKCTCRMIAEKPIWGYGADGFRKYYMNFQEQYFAENPDSIYADLADNIVHPFNEYLQVIVNHGFVGFGVLALFIGLLLYITRKERNSSNYDSVLSLSGIAVFALFSYPLSYKVCWFFIICNTIAITGIWKILRNNIKPLYILIMCVAIISAGMVYWQSQAEKREAAETWHELSRLSFDRNDKQKYYKAGEILNNAEYWYELGAGFYFHKMYNDCLSAISRSENLNNNTDVQILKGICLEELGKYDLAESHYKSAHNMCPKLIKPLYLLVKLYEQTGDTVAAKSMAIMVLNKKVKVESFETDAMKEDLKNTYTIE